MQKNKNHFSPVFANKSWTNQESGWSYKYYYYCKHRGLVIDCLKDKGKTAWGYELNLYSQQLEDKLDVGLENDSAVLYEKLLNGVALTAGERMKWGQFIIAQAVRTPSFFKYRDYIEEINNGDYSYKDTILGCQWCEENKFIAERNWYILIAHEDDYFVRTDNPVYMTGFLENPTTTILYPLSPKKCFIACSFVEYVPLLIGQQLPLPKQDVLQLGKGDAHKINFDLVKSANTSIIVSKQDDNVVINRITLDMLGRFPQIPYMLSHADNDWSGREEEEKILRLMSIVDGVAYPVLREYDFKPFYGVEFSMGINPFSFFGVTDEKLKELHPEVDFD